VFNVLFVGYSLAKNNLNNTYQYMISKNFSKAMNYLIILLKFKVSRFWCRSVYLTKNDFPVSRICFDFDIHSHGFDDFCTLLLWAF
jgi:hypothetical protein